MLAMLVFGFLHKPPATVVCNQAPQGYICVVTARDKGPHVLESPPDIRGKIPWSGGGRWAFDAKTPPKWVLIDGKKVEVETK